MKCRIWSISEDLAGFFFQSTRHIRWQSLQQIKEDGGVVSGLSNEE